MILLSRWDEAACARWEMLAGCCTTLGRLVVQGTPVSAFLCNNLHERI
jgi:hypothetical protein